MTGNLAKQKMRGRQGFSLMELLFALLITSLAGMLAIGGIGVATRMFQDVLLHSQVQLVMKEYMSEMRSGFLCAEMDSALQIEPYNPDDSDTIDPAFAHSGYKYAGFFKVMGNDGGAAVVGADGHAWGVIVFQPAIYDYATNKALKTAPNGQTLQPPIRLISTRLSDEFPATMTYRYENGKFILSLSVRSNRTLSTGEHVELTTGEIAITPTGK